MTRYYVITLKDILGGALAFFIIDTLFYGIGVDFKRLVYVFLLMLVAGIIGLRTAHAEEIRRKEEEQAKADKEKGEG